MAGTLEGRRVAILAADGVELVEYAEPRKAVEAEGAVVTLVSLKPGTIQSVTDDIHPADQLQVDATVDSVTVDDFDALLLPGGAVNPDTLRLSGDAVRFVRNFVDSGRPVAAICHAPWLLVEADVVRGRTLTSYPSIRTDLRNAGAHAVDEEVATDGNLVTSRSPDDLPAFCAAVTQAFAAA